MARKQFQALFKEVYTAEAVIDFASVATGAEAASDVTVTGAALGDFAMVSCSIDVADLALTAQVTAANTVTVQVVNNTGGAVDLASATFKIVVLHPDFNN